MEELLEKNEIKNNIIAASYDTTATNTGHLSGSVILLEQSIGKRILKLPCRRHINELHVKHFAEKTSGRKTSENGDVLFKRYQKKFDQISHNIDYNNMKKFDWAQAEENLVLKARGTLSWVLEVLSNNSFERGDYRRISELIAIYLGHEYQFSI